MPDKLDDGQEIDWPVPYWFVDAGAALMLLLLAAIDEGLGAGRVGRSTRGCSGAPESFGIPEDVTVIALVTMGVAAPDPAWSAVTSRRTQPRRAAGRGRSLGALRSCGSSLAADSSAD